MLERELSGQMAELYGRNYNISKPHEEKIMSQMSVAELKVKTELYQWLIGKPFYARSSDSVLLQKLAFVQSLLQHDTGKECDQYFQELAPLSYAELEEKKNHYTWLAIQAHPIHNDKKSDAWEMLLKIEAFMKMKAKRKEEYPADIRKKIPMKQFIEAIRDELYTQQYDGVYVLKGGGF